MLRGRSVLLDADLAELYGVPTKRLNEQVKRNRARFPEDFAFRLQPEEVEGLNRSQFATGSKRHRDPKVLPWAFTEHGALAAAFVVNSPRAVAVGQVVVRALVTLRQLAASHEELGRRLAALETQVGAHDEDLRQICTALQRLLEAPDPDETRRQIGFRPADED